MTDLQYILKTIKSREKEEKARLERNEKFNAICRKERERVLNLLIQKANESLTFDSETGLSFVWEDDLKQIIEELKGDE